MPVVFLVIQRSLELTDVVFCREAVRSCHGLAPAAVSDWAHRMGGSMLINRFTRLAPSEVHAQGQPLFPNGSRLLLQGAAPNLLTCYVLLPSGGPVVAERVAAETLAHQRCGGD